MISSRQWCRLGILAIAVLTDGTGWSQSPPAKQAASTTAARPVVTRSASPKGVLPDPALLDGSTYPQEKQSEFGMIGDFELPGDENVRSGRVGGPQGQIPAGSGKNQVAGGPMGKSGVAAPLPGAAPSVVLPQGGPMTGGGQGQPPGGAGGPENQNASGNPLGTDGTPGAQPQGIQVAGLGGPAGHPDEASGQNANGKPTSIPIGDKSMRIEIPTTSAPVIGAKSEVINNNTQIYEKPTGTGGKAPTLPQGPNRAEKGRAIPQGL